MNQLDFMFREENNYSINKVFATSFTFSTLFLGEILLRMASFNSPGLLKGTTVQKKLVLKREIQKQRENQKLFIFAHDFGESEPVAYELINGANIFLKRFILANQNSFVNKIKTKNGYFHPKLILVELKSENNENDENDYKYRLLVSSKNMVRDNYYQLGMFFEGITSDGDDGVSKPLSMFIKSMSDEAFKEPFKKPLKDLADRLSKAKFTVENTTHKIKNLELLFGLPDSYIDKDGLHANEHLFERFSKDFADKERWSIITDSLNIDFIDQIKNHPQKERIYIIDNGIQWLKQAPNSTDIKEKFGKITEKCSPYIPTENNSYWHAKVLSSSCDKKQIVWVGSANFTNAAFNNNYECCVYYEVDTEKINAPFDICGLSVLEHRELHQEDLQNAQNDEQKIMEEFLDIMKNVSLCSTVDIEKHVLDICIKQNGETCQIEYSKDEKKYGFNDYWIKGVKIHFPLGYGETECNVQDWISNSKCKQFPTTQIKFKKGSINDFSQIIITFSLVKKGMGMHSTLFGSFWKTLIFDAKQGNALNKMREEYKDSEDCLKVGKGLLRGDVPKMSDAIPQHDRKNDTNNTELLLATFLEGGNWDEKLNIIETNIKDIQESIEELVDTNDDEFGYDEIVISDYSQAKNQFIKLKSCIAGLKME